MAFFNILQCHADGRTQLMLGASVGSRDEAIPHLAHYIGGHDRTNRARVANGYPPLDCTYQIVEVPAEWSDDFPDELKGVQGHVLAAVFGGRTVQ